jgi:hypothetical protein
LRARSGYTSLVYTEYILVWLCRKLTNTLLNTFLEPTSTAAMSVNFNIKGNNNLLLTGFEPMQVAIITCLTCSQHSHAAAYWMKSLASNHTFQRWLFNNTEGISRKTKTASLLIKCHLLSFKTNRVWYLTTVISNYLNIVSQFSPNWFSN